MAKAYLRCVGLPDSVQKKTLSLIRVRKGRERKREKKRERSLKRHNFQRYFNEVFDSPDLMELTVEAITSILACTHVNVTREDKVRLEREGKI